MSVTLEPTLAVLDDCGCCEGVTAGILTEITNRPGLTAIAYRAGDHATFRASMQSALSATPNQPLRALQTRELGDFTLALADAWATALDVLTFYQERIANEAYLRTATERLSLLHLARLIGYELRPGVAAATHLAFTLETAPGAPLAITLPPGIRVQSVPEPGEAPQTFETVEAITARPAWNDLRPQQTGPQVVTTDMATLWIADMDANLKTGDHILIVAPRGDGLRFAVRRVTLAERDDANRRVRVDLGSGLSDAAPAGGPTGVWALRARGAPFGHNAPKQPDAEHPADLSLASEWTIDEPDRTRLTLDAVYDGIRDGSWVAVERPQYGRTSYRGRRTRGREVLLCRAENLRTVSRASYGITGRATQVALDQEWLHEYVSTTGGLRETVVYMQSEPLTPAEAPLGRSMPRNAIELTGDYGDLRPGQAVVVSGVLLGQSLDQPRTSELATVTTVGRSASGRTVLTFATDLAAAFDLRSVSINANVALATHGETVAEVLGSGNAAQPYQRFTLKGAPLTYVATANAAGAESTLEVRANDLLWHETPSLVGRGPTERVYTIRMDDEARTTVQFGDGLAGARLPTGIENVRARYRKGIGAAGNLKAGQLSLLLTRPPGLREVTNPLPATGGADRDDREDARRNAPLTVLTLGRVVSLKDYEDFARAFPGIAKALATWTWDGRQRGIYLTVAGADGASVPAGGPVQVNLVNALRVSGDPRVPLWVQPYRPASFKVVATVTPSADYLPDQVAARVRAALLSTFSFDVREFGQPILRSEVLTVMQSVPGVVGVDLDALHRSDQPVSLAARLAAALPTAGSASASATAAELLTLSETGVTLAIL